MSFESPYISYWWIRDPLHRSHNAPVPYPTMQHFYGNVQMCAKWCIVGYLTNALWSLGNGSIGYTICGTWPWYVNMLYVNDTNTRKYDLRLITSQLVTLFEIYFGKSFVWLFQLTDALWHPFASVNYIINGSSDGLSPVRYKAIN